MSGKGMGVLRPLRIVAAEVAALALLVTFLLTEQLITSVALLVVGALGALWVRRWTAGADGRPWRLLGENRTWTFGVLVVLLLTVPFVLRSSSYWLFVLVLAGVNALMAIGLNIQVGSADMVNLGFAGFAAIGAYTSALLSRNAGISPWLAFVIGGLAASAVGLFVGLPAARTRGYYYSLVTIAFGIIVFLVLINLRAVGGPDGLGGIPPFSIGRYSLRQPLSIGGLLLPAQSGSYYLLLSLVALAVLAGAQLYRSVPGLVWNALREDEIAARTLGIDVARAKLWAMGLGMFLGGVAGAFYAHTVGFIAPDNFTFLHSVMLVSMVILGGADNVAGVVLGALVLTVVPEKFRAFQDYRLLLYGVVLVLMLHLRPQGLLPRVIRTYACVPARPNGVRQRTTPVAANTLLSAEGLTIRFGGLTAVDHVSLHVQGGEILGIIGPNGSGKTTLFNLISGIYQPHAGHVLLKGEEITGLPAHRIARLGVARTFQISRLFLDLSVLDNVILGLVGGRSHSWVDPLIRPRRATDQLSAWAAQARDLLKELSPDLAERCYHPARELTLVERRRLEICRALASEPDLLLLDEPSAGLDARETRELMEEILRLRTQRPAMGIVLIEHDMSVVRGLANRVIVLNYGRKIVEGQFDEIATSPEVREAYLGT